MARKKTDKERALIINRIIEMVKEQGSITTKESLRCSTLPQHCREISAHRCRTGRPGSLRSLRHVPRPAE
ncbi:TPA: DUF977 family protein [Enterobacter bugandensis]|uniref:DUF977 family protein n=1 Tax=Enterobacter sp. BNK-13 TaxID=3376150 RepID=UPI0037868B2C